jgi:poly(3-hydroxybutyrate) depolymerase
LSEGHAVGRRGSRSDVINLSGAVETQDVAFTPTSDGSEQRYVLVLPDGIDSQVPTSVLIALHGHGSDR